MNTKLEVLKQIFHNKICILGSKSRYLFSGNKACRNMSHDRVAEIFLHTGSNSNKYVGLTVSIVNKLHGEIARNQFSFEQYLGATANRPPNTNDITMHVWEDAGVFKWYMIFPTTTDPIEAAINEYIDFYDMK